MTQKTSATVRVRFPKRKRESKLNAVIAGGSVLQRSSRQGAEGRNPFSVSRGLQLYLGASRVCGRSSQ